MRSVSYGYARLTYREFDWVYTLGEDAREKLGQLGIDHSSVLSLGVDTALFTPAARDPGYRAELGLAVDDRHIMTGTRKVVGRGDTDDTAAEDQDFHASSYSRVITLAAARKPARNGESNCQPTRLMASPRIETILSMWLFSTMSGGDIATESPLGSR